MSVLTSAWLVGGLAAGAVGTLLLLYFLKLKRKPVAVPTTLLWRKAVEDLTVNAPFQRLRRSILLILQLLILLLLLAAIARPLWLGADRPAGGRFVVLVDVSASMQATDVKPSRLDQAKDLADAYVQGLAEGSEVMLIAFSSTARVVTPRTADRPKVRAALRQLTPTEGRSNVAEALTLAEAHMVVGTAEVQDVADQRTSSAAATLVMFSDGNLSDLADQSLRRTKLEYVRVGADPPPAELAGMSTVPNVAVLALDARRDYEAPETLHALARVENFGPDPVQCDVVLRRGQKIEQVVPVRLGPQRPPGAAQDQGQPTSVRSVPFKPLVATEGVTLAVTLEGLPADDALSVDNQAFEVVPPPRLLRVLVVTPGNTPLRQAVSVLRLDKADVMTPEAFAAQGPPTDPSTGERVHDVVVIDQARAGVRLSTLPPGGYLLFGSVPITEGLTALGEAEDESAAVWDESHAVLRHVQVSTLFATRMPRLALPASARVLVRGRSAPMLFELQVDGRRLLVAPFDLFDTYWPLDASFPLFCHNAIQYLGIAATGAGADLRPGDTWSVGVRVDDANAPPAIRLRGPGGWQSSRQAQPTGLAVFPDLPVVGVYSAEGPVIGPAQVAVNLFDRRESDLTPAAKLVLGGGAQEVVGSAGNVPMDLEIWPWLALAALGVVLLEWWVYNRRVQI